MLLMLNSQGGSDYAQHWAVMTTAQLSIAWGGDPVIVSIDVLLAA